MSEGARIGQFSVASGSYGSPVPTVKPSDNVATPSAADVVAQQQQSTLDAIYAQLKAAAGTTSP